MKRRYLIVIVTILILFGVAYCFVFGSSTNTTTEAIPAVPVVVKTVQAKQIHLWYEFSGRLQAVDSVEIRHEVSGRITQVRFQDGNRVKVGDILFVIDPRPYEAAVARAEATLATAISDAHFAKIELERAENMVKTEAVAQRIFDERSKDNDTAVAAVKSAEAQLKQANLDLEHAYVRSPIAGRAGRVEITLGNLVQAGPNAPLMTRVNSSDPIYADFDVDEQTYIQSIRHAADNQSLERHVPVELSVQGDKEYSYIGTIYSFDNRLDPSSGTIRARAKFTNTDGVLVPGMFVTVKIASGDKKDVFLIPQRAIGYDQNKKYVYIVDKDQKAEYRPIELGPEVENQRVVLKGLSAGDRVIVNGLQHVKPGSVVTAKEEGANDG